MTIQLQFDDDNNRVRYYIYRRIYPPKNYSDIVSSFYKQIGNFRKGRLIQLKGKTSTLLHSF